MAYKRGAIIRRYNKRRYKGTRSTALVRVSTATFMWERNSFKGNTFFWFLFYTVKYIYGKREISIPSGISALSPINVLIKLRARSTESLWNGFSTDDRLIFLFSRIPIESMSVADG